LIEVSRPWPETIRSRAVAGSFHTMTPDALCEIDSLAGLDHFRRRQRRQLTFLETFRDRLLSEQRDAGASGHHDNSERYRWKQN
jgi:hypothetical protein